MVSSGLEIPDNPVERALDDALVELVLDDLVVLSEKGWVVFKTA